MDAQHETTQATELMSFIGNKARERSNLAAAAAAISAHPKRAT